MSDSMAGFVEAVSRLPVFRGLAWRAADVELTMPVTATAPIPTSRLVRVATENFRSSSVHLFVCTAARDIALLSAHPASGEVVILPGARLVPTSALHEVGGLRVQVVLEQPGPTESLPAMPTDEDIAALIDAARRDAPVPIAQPGRFGAVATA